jgi:L-fucose mutarotase
MLKGINPLLGPELLRTLRAMGHGDEIAIVDANYPAETDAKQLIRMDGNNAVELLDAILSVMPIDTFVPEAVFRPAAMGDPKRVEAVHKDFAKTLARHEPKQRIVPLAGQDFYDRVKACFAVVASGERRLYGNIVLKKGVIAP